MKLASLRSLSLVCFAAAAATAHPAMADGVTDQIELGLELYQEGEYGAAITELEFAISEIRKAMSGKIAGTFPDAPAGWTAMAPSDGGGDGGGAALLGIMGGGTALERVYVEDGGDGRMEASLMIDNPMIQGFGAMLSNPALIAAQPNSERIRIGREAGMLKWEPERRRAEATLLLDGRILVRIEGSNLSDSELAAALLRDWDLEALRAEAAR